MAAPYVLPDAVTTAQLGAPYSDYSNVEDTETDLAAASVNTLIANIAAITAVCPKALVVVDTTSTTPNDYRSVWGYATALQPTITINGTGDVTLEWASSYATLHPTDTTTKSVQINGATATVQDSTSLFCSVQKVSAVKLRVRCWNAAGVATDCVFAMVVT